MDYFMSSIWVCSSMVEQWPFKPLVGGSSPPGPTFIGDWSCWVIGCFVVHFVFFLLGFFLYKIEFLS